MRPATSTKLRAYLALTAAATLAGLATGRPELVALAAPFAAYVALGLTIGRRPHVSVTPTIPSHRVLEGDEIPVSVEVSARSPVERLQLQLAPGPGLMITGASRPGIAARLEAGESRHLRPAVRAEHWGLRALGVLSARATDRFGLIEYELAPTRLGSVRVFPRMETLETMIEPLELQATTGNRVSRERGDGIEFAEVRPFVPGDRIRRINWRVTARRGEPYVSERHPERNADVILFLDTFAEVTDAHGSTLELAVRAAASVAGGYLARRDRVGVVGFGGALTGLRPGFGAAQLYRILDALIGSEVTFSYTHKDVSLVPRQMLPPKALVIAITPLIDDRSINALFDLRSRGFDLAVIEISPVPFTEPGPIRADALAHRLWLLRRAALRTRFESLGVPVTEWHGEQPLQVPVASASTFRRRIRRPVAA
jgi:uncharacterized protein (DUF58 family)